MAHSSKKKPSKKNVSIKKKTPLKVTATPKKKVPAKKKQVAKKRNTKNELNCFLTSACVKHYHLADNCYQLNTLRNYRDNYLLSTKENSKLVESYYQIAPKIVNQIEAHENKSKIYEEVFERIEIACLEIESKQFEKAKHTYKRLVKEVIHQLKTSNSN